MPPIALRPVRICRFLAAAALLLALAGCPEEGASTICEGALFADPSAVTVEVFTDETEFELALSGFTCLVTVDFDDVDASGDDPVTIEGDRYLASHGVRIEGDGSQYVHTDFGLPDDFEDAPSEPNLFAPGPVADSGDDGGFETWVDFESDGVVAGVAAFSLVFVDADRPDVASSGMTALARDGSELASEMDVESSGGGHAFVGFVATDAEGRPGPGIFQIEVVSGDEWAGLNESEDVALDDLTFLEPVP